MKELYHQGGVVWKASGLILYLHEVKLAIPHFIYEGAIYSAYYRFVCPWVVGPYAPHFLQLAGIHELSHILYVRKQYISPSNAIFFV